ncbi:MAG: hypothetical protein US96_C0031G0009, partial [Candidatus Woesebacteria bacterium GW2011_GWB1_38_5b]
PAGSSAEVNLSQGQFIPNTQTEDNFFVSLLSEQELGLPWPFNPLKYAIRGAVTAGVPATTIVMLLLLPLIAAFIAATRHIIGLRGFGIFFPAALSVVFLALGPVLGILLFLIIVFVSVGARSILHSLKLKMQYLPRMSLILLFVSLSVLGLLFLAPLINNQDLTKTSIFPVLPVPHRFSSGLPGERLWPGLQGASNSVNKHIDPVASHRADCRQPDTAAHR